MKRVIGVVLAVVMLLSGCGGETRTWQEQYDLGIRYLRDGNYEEAILAFEAAIEIDPKRADAYIGLAAVYVQQGDYEQAEETLERGLSESDDPTKIRRRLEELDELKPDKPDEEKTENPEEEKTEKPARESDPDGRWAKMSPVELLDQRVSVAFDIWDGEYEVYGWNGSKRIHFENGETVILKSSETIWDEALSGNECIGYVEMYHDVDVMDGIYVTLTYPQIVELAGQLRAQPEEPELIAYTDFVEEGYYSVSFIHKNIRFVYDWLEQTADPQTEPADRLTIHWVTPYPPAYASAYLQVLEDLEAAQKQKVPTSDGRQQLLSYAALNDLDNDGTPELVCTYDTSLWIYAMQGNTAVRCLEAKIGGAYGQTGLNGTVTISRDDALGWIIVHNTDDEWNEDHWTRYSMWNGKIVSVEYQGRRPSEPQLPVLEELEEFWIDGSPVSREEYLSQRTRFMETKRVESLDIWMYQYAEAHGSIAQTKQRLNMR